jgi:hypothetical protein
MIKVYFDKNVLSHILASQRGAAETNGVTTDYLKALLEVSAVGKIVNLLSEMHLQEAAYALKAASPSVAQEELRLIRDLMDTKQIIKPAKVLLADDIMCYARGRELSSPLIPNHYDLDAIFSVGGDIADRVQALDETTEQNSEFLNVTTDAREDDRSLVESEFGGKKPTFEEFYDQRILPWIIRLVEKTQRATGKGWLLDACKERGIEGLLKVKSVALAEGISLSYQYARIFGEMSEKKKRRGGDPNDLKHALYASAADALVTHDGDFVSLIGRVPNKGIEVLDHLSKLVERIS